MSFENGSKFGKGITRRQFLKGGTLAAVGLASGGLIAGCDSDNKQGSKKKTASDENGKTGRWS